MSTYAVIVTGEILPGFELEEVKEEIARLFKVKEKRLDRVFSGKQLIVKNDLDLDRAEAYQNAIQNAGLGCIIKLEEKEVLKRKRAEEQEEQESAISELMPDAQMSEIHPQSDETNDEHNPYEQPQAELSEASEATELNLVDPNGLSAGAGWDWIGEGYYYFKQNIGAWIGAIIIFLVIMMGLSILPFVSLISNLLTPVFSAGFMIACYKIYQGDKFTVTDIFEGFKTNLWSLVAVGAIYMIGTILIVVAVFAVMFGAMGFEQMMEMSQGGDPSQFAMFGGSIAIAVLLVMALIIPLVMAYYFAPALVVFHNISPFRAMALSFQGCLRNMVPFLVYGIVMLVLAIIASIPLMLGWLALGPVVLASTFAAYRQIFTDSTLAR
jgi:hypothetical protein